MNVGAGEQNDVGRDEVAGGSRAGSGLGKHARRVVLMGRRVERARDEEQRITAGVLLHQDPAGRSRRPPIRDHRHSDRMRRIGVLGELRGDRRDLTGAVRLARGRGAQLLVGRRFTRARRDRLERDRYGRLRRGRKCQHLLGRQYFCGRIGRAATATPGAATAKTHATPHVAIVTVSSRPVASSTPSADTDTSPATASPELKPSVFTNVVKSRVDWAGMSAREHTSESPAPGLHPGMAVPSNPSGVEPFALAWNVADTLWRGAADLFWMPTVHTAF